MASVFRRERSKYWWAKVCVRGNEHRFSTKQTTKREALRVAKDEEDRLYELRFGIKKRAKGKAFGDAFPIYLESVKANKSFSHWNTQRKFYEGQFLPYFDENRNIMEFDPLLLTRYLDKRKRDGVSDTTRNLELASLKAFFTFAETNHWVNFKPTDQVKMFKAIKKPRQEFSLEESRRILEVDHPGTVLFWLFLVLQFGFLITIVHFDPCFFQFLLKENR